MESKRNCTKLTLVTIKGAPWSEPPTKLNPHCSFGESLRKFSTKVCTFVIFVINTKAFDSYSAL